MNEGKPKYRNGQEVMFKRSATDDHIFVGKIGRILFAPAHMKWWYKFEIPDKFIVGYGLDFNELFRQLPYIGIYKEN